MIYTVENTLRVGNVVDYILDANGERIHGPTVECNTETGEVIQLHVQYGIPSNMTRKLMFAAPLQVVFARHLTSNKR
jgi:uncharacterized protein YrrD